ncbi:hypothetical protein F5Y07DRAFT_176110 [Xylaria sp. FL0933]|nr:hypothetical protein F5Y07DRAFT_176110 [Xylaria sp. FL0933]
MQAHFSTTLLTMLSWALAPCSPIFTTIRSSVGSHFQSRAPATSCIPHEPGVETRSSPAFVDVLVCPMLSALGRDGLFPVRLVGGIPRPEPTAQ